MKASQTLYLSFFGILPVGSEHTHQPWTVTEQGQVSEQGQSPSSFAMKLVASANAHIWLHFTSLHFTPASAGKSCDVTQHPLPTLHQRGNIAKTSLSTPVGRVAQWEESSNAIHGFRVNSHLAKRWWRMYCRRARDSIPVVDLRR